MTSKSSATDDASTAASGIESTLVELAATQAKQGELLLQQAATLAKHGEILEGYEKDFRGDNTTAGLYERMRKLESPWWLELVKGLALLGGAIGGILTMIEALK